MELRRLDTETHVLFYENEFYPLSNFSAFQVKIWGRQFMTSEHAYHFAKFMTGDPGIAERIRVAPSAHEAMKIAHASKECVRKDWEGVKLLVMSAILRAKVEQHEYVKRKLLETGDRTLVEDSWRDDFWGWGKNRDGQNQLGRLWMKIRKELRS